jgi:hypothetical protein
MMINLIGPSQMHIPSMEESRIDEVENKPHRNAIQYNSRTALDLGHHITHL